MELPESLQKWSYDELVALNRAIVAHLKERDALKAKREIQQFQLGNIVQFMSSEDELIQGTVSKLNKKTVNIVTPEGTQWKVSPSLLTKVSGGFHKESLQEIIEFDDSIEI